jgi:hypothetical protein
MDLDEQLRCEQTKKQQQTESLLPKPTAQDNRSGNHQIHKALKVDKASDDMPRGETKRGDSLYFDEVFLGS